MDERHKYTVCIHCMTYNHEKYLADALEGFVMQKTTFPFVAIVHDDASTDGTATVLRQYAEKYPDIIKPIYETENQYSKHDGSIGRIMDAEMAKYNPKYIAICEGDDYWTDPYKLQKQVDFLEGHLDYSMCFHAAKIKNETDTKVITTCDDIEDKEYLTNDIFPGWVIPTASVVYRKGMIDKFPPLMHQEWFKYGDIVLFLRCMHTGRVWGMREPMSVYRMTENGAVVSQRNEKDYYERMCKHYEALMLNFPQLDRRWPNAYIATYNYTKFRNSSTLKDKISALYVAFRHDPRYVLQKLLKLNPHGTY